MSEKIDFTVIIPHKNQPDLLAKSIASIPHRENVQIIVVDDNSDPSIVDFDDFPGQSDSNVELIFTKEGRGAGYARNIALPHVKGRWLTFLGADDFFFPNCAQLMDMIVNEDSQVVFFKGKGMRLSDNSLSTRGDGYNDRVDIAIHTGDFTPVLLYSCDARKFYSTQFLKEHSIRFSECRWGNDVFFMGQVARYATEYKAVDMYVYCATESDSSLTRARSIESMVVRLKEECKNVSILRPRYSKEDELYNGLFQTWMGVWKVNRLRAIMLLPRTIYAGGHPFIKVIFKACF